MILNSDNEKVLRAISAPKTAFWLEPRSQSVASNTEKN